MKFDIWIFFEKNQFSLKSDKIINEYVEIYVYMYVCDNVLLRYS